MGAVGRRGGIGLDLGPVERDEPQAHHPGGRAQLERGHQQPGQGLFVADPEPGDGHMIRGAVAGQDPEGDVLVTASLDLTRGADPDAVAIQQHAQQHPGLIGGPAVPIRSVRLEERVKVELVDHIKHEPGQMIGRQPVTQVRWEQERLVTVAGKEVVGHGRSYAIGLLCYPHYRPSQQPFLQQAVKRSPTAEPLIDSPNHDSLVRANTERRCGLNTGSSASPESLSDGVEPVQDPFEQGQVGTVASVGRPVGYDQVLVGHVPD